MNDVTACAALAASSWERMVAEAATYRDLLERVRDAAARELDDAIEAFFSAPGLVNALRVDIAELALARAEGRLR